MKLPVRPPVSSSSAKPSDFAKTSQQAYQQKLPVPTYSPPVVYRGLDVVRDILSRCVSGKVLVYGDPDMDGLVAFRFICKILSRMGIQYQTYINPNRAHGFLLRGEDVAGYTVINGDFLVTEENVIDIVSHGASIISFDHHECQPTMIHKILDESGQVVDGKYGGLLNPPLPDPSSQTPHRPQGIVINNQYPFEDQSQLFQSGAGVTFEALRQLDPSLDTQENRALVGVTLHTDIRDTETPPAHAWLYDAYSFDPFHPENQPNFIRPMIEGIRPGKLKYGFPRLDRSFIQFTLSPAVNSLLRFNRGEESLHYILSGIYPRGDIRASQKRLLADIDSKAFFYEYSDTVFVEVPEPMFLPSDSAVLSNFVGLYCSRVVEQYGKSVVGFTTNKYGEVTRTSFRCRLSSADYRSKYAELVTAVGHAMAFGIKDMEPSHELFTALNEKTRLAENGVIPHHYYVPIDDLSTFVTSPLSIIAEKNSYLKEENYIYLKYTPSATRLQKEERGSKPGTNHPSVIEWDINGVSVLSFNHELTPDNAYIFPVVERNREITYVLSKAVVPEFAVELPFDVASDPSRVSPSVDTSSQVSAPNTVVSPLPPAPAPISPFPPASERPDFSNFEFIAPPAPPT